ncbi:protein YrfG [Pasteurella canis]|uniref:Protein YrfG n=1 Tax=Pasteurella canis TaxID=753 RepID=A0A379EWF9_9PAST|nr:GMP/IMP nucleotidase [Pasteurella canis]SUC10721.1 protein YrfG [Pasteurella canis]
MLAINWHQIDTVILDLDGTLIDLYFDHYFWKQLVPQAYAAKFSLPFEQSQQVLKQRYDAIEHSKDWYCLDFWAKQLDLPLRELYQSHGPELKVRSDVVPFLQVVKQMGKHVVLLTDSNVFSLEAKLKFCDFVPHFDLLLSSHQFGAPKIEQALWQNLQKQHYFEPMRTLFIDDTEKVLDSAKQFGIAYTIGVENPDSTLPYKHFERHFSVKDYRTLVE